MAVTFTLDLRALLAAPAAMAFTESASVATDDGSHEPIELLHALRSQANKITVFSQVGEIALPASRRVFAFLERVVVPVDAPLGGVVHPKVWVLRYEADGEPTDGRPRARRLRVLIASRNLTFDASWDTVVRLDEAADAAGALLRPVGELFKGLIGAAVGTVSPHHRDRVDSLAAALGTARFALPAGVEDLQTHVLGLSGTPSPLPATTDRSLILSPFVSDDFFTSVHPVPVDELVSRPESLDLLKPGTLARVEGIYAFDDGSTPDVGTEQEGSSSDDPGRPLVGLHAKAFAFESKGRARLFLGSANATGAAFTSNVEVLVELAGPIAVLGIDRLCAGTNDELGLRALFQRYGGRGSGGDTDGEPSLGRARRAIARLPFEGLVEESGSEWAVTYRSGQPMPSLDGMEIYCWPLASAGHRRRVVAGEPLQARFETSLETISGFLAFQLGGDRGTRTRFVVPVPLLGVPDHRERFILRALVGNAERFLRYLLALLDEDSDRADLCEAVESVIGDTATDGVAPVELPVLEKLLRTMRRDPAKLIALHPLVSDLAEDDALPPGFTELWTMIYDVAIAGVVDR
ncbi:MAG: hypothetical protein F4Y62_04155 [Rhodospirillaceae bacterium]|nr:hypothetical protein [Rhodospirillaceae bacterium]